MSCLLFVFYLIIFMGKREREIKSSMIQKQIQNKINEIIHLLYMCYSFKRGRLKLKIYLAGPVNIYPTIRTNININGATFTTNKVSAGHKGHLELSV